MDIKVEKDGIILVNRDGSELIHPKDAYELIQALTRALFDWYNIHRKENT